MPLTKPGGINAISGYFVDPNKAEIDGNYFGPNELLSAYDTPAWNILSYREDPTSTTEFAQKQHVNSLATIIAQKRDF
jgi:hypothetical protein